MIDEEQHRFKLCKQQLFGNLNASLHILENQIASRRNLLQLEDKILLIQSVWRGYVIRKQYRPQIRSLKQRIKIVEEILSTEKLVLN